MPEIHGNVEGIRKSLLDRLMQWYDLQIPTDSFMPQDLLLQLCGYSASMNREIALYITRYGEIAEIILGKADSVDLPDVRLRRSNSRLSMIRCVHTHPGSGGELSDVDVSALHTMRFDAMCAVGVDKDGRPTTAQAAFLDPSALDGVRKTELVNARKLPDAQWLQTILEVDAVYVAQDAQVRQSPERAVLVGIESGESLQELGELARSAGAEPIAVVLQKRDKPDTAYCIGKGKAQELSLQCQALRADVVIVDEELTGVMQKNLEEVLRLKVVDRTTLILDSFASRANTREGKIQVEMAQLQYRSQRLLGQGLVLSRLAGGIGTRGPGESKLEVNRRRIRERLTDLKRELEQVEKQRGLRRQQRERSQIPLVALVGYTNAGKSTLFNRLTGSGVYVEDQLFATLDSVSRPIVLPHGGRALLVDTVGFIRKLPHELVKAFRATLEEAALADVNVIVSDAAAPELMQQHATVLEVLDSLGATQAHRIDALNKSDLGGTGQEAFPGAVVISAKTGEGVGELLAAIEERLEEGMQTVRLLVPFANYGLLSKLHSYGSVLRQEHGEEGVTVILRAKAQYVKNAYEEGALPVGDEHK
ncbi:MAG: GTPase HflX [Candidatus Limiplasma sp.]|nr:GTPase HflX [Candidatus Limiplasma sp.]